MSGRFPGFGIGKPRRQLEPLVKLELRHLPSQNARGRGSGDGKVVGVPLSRLPPALQRRVPEAAAAALALIFILTLLIGAQYVNQIGWVQHTLEVKTKIAALWSKLQDIETGQRSFVLTGDERFLEPFKFGASGWAEDLDALDHLVADNPEQVDAVAQARPLIEKRLTVAQGTIHTRQAEGFDAARQQVLDGAGLGLTQRLREAFRQMQERESLLLESRIASARQTTVALASALLVLFFGTVIALGAWVITQRRSSQRLAQTNEALRQTIAAREATEMQMRQMQKMEAVGQLTGGIAHDFNNMLAVIISGVSLARRRLASGQAGASELLASTMDGANRAAALVKKLLAFSRQQPLEPRVIDANKFVSGMHDLIARALGESIHVETVLGGGLWPTWADPSQLETAILNLCVNARDAMPNGGRLTIETANCHLDDRYSRLHPGVPPGQYVLIAVTDTGTGMSQDIAAKAFDPFFTTKPPGVGTGLGLSQVFGFVSQSGGHAKIYSEAGQGSTLKIYLPRYTGKVEDVVAPVAVPEHRGTETILLVEDDPSVLALTASALRELGYSVLETRHGKDAIDILKSGRSLDLMLTDVVMPEMNGRSLAEQASELRPDMKVLFMTGFTKNAIVHNGVLDPGVHLLAKPFTIEELSAKVREALGTEIRISTS